MTEFCPDSLFFCGGIWGVSFHIGVYKALVEKWGYEKISRMKKSQIIV